MIHLIRSRATLSQVNEMIESLEVFIKLAVDTRKRILAGGGVLHADCEAVLLEDGSRQEDIWGADWHPGSQQVTYEALINIRPRRNNRSMRILEPEIQERVKQIVEELLGGV